MSTETIQLIEATDSTGTVHRFSTGTGYMSLPTDTPPNAYYEPRIDQPGSFQQSMFSKGTTGGNSSGGKGVVDLHNTDFALDYLLDLGFDGQPFVVKEGNPGAALSTFATVITATVEQCESSWNRITFNLKDRMAELNTPAQLTHYLGNNVAPDGIEGALDLKDKPKPRLFGVCNNITPVCVNTSKLVYQVNNGPVFDIPAVHDGGNVNQIVKGADYATSALLLAATMPAATNPPTPPGSYSTCLAEGLFRLDAAPFMQLTCDVVEGATTADRTVGQIAKKLAGEKVGASAIVAQSIIDLDKAAPYEVGYYTGTDDPTTSAILDALCQSVGAWYGFDNLGNFWCKQLTAPVAAQAVMTLTKNEILTIDRTATADGDRGVPVYRVNVDYAKNWTVQTSGLAGSLPENALAFAPEDSTPLDLPRRQLLGMEYQRTKDQDLTVLDKHKLAPTLTLKTLLNNGTDANTEASRTLALKKVGRDRLTVKVPVSAVRYPSGGYWDDESIADIPEAKGSHGSVIYGNYLYVFGGSITPSPYNTARVDRLDLSNPYGIWETSCIADMPAMRSSLGNCTFLVGSYVYVVGGSEAGLSTNTVWRFDLSNLAGSWETSFATPLPEVRLGHVSFEYGGYIYIMGGFSVSTILNTTYRLNLSAPLGAWQACRVMPSNNRNAGYVLNGTYVYLIGGQTGTSALTAVATVMRLNLTDPIGNTWDDAGVTNLPRAMTSMTAIRDNEYIYTVAGRDQTLPFPFFTPLIMRLKLSKLTGTWEQTAVSAMSAGRITHTAHIFNGSMYVIGGTTLSAVTANTWRLRTNTNPEDASHRTGLGRTLLVKYDRNNYSSGKPMKIIGTDTDYKNRLITFELWG